MDGFSARVDVVQTRIDGVRPAAESLAEPNVTLSDLGVGIGTPAATTGQP